MRKKLLSKLPLILIWTCLCCSRQQALVSTAKETPPSPPTASLTVSPSLTAALPKTVPPAKATPLLPTASPTPSVSPTESPTPTYTSSPSWVNYALQSRAMVPQARDDVKQLPLAPFYDLDVYAKLSGQEPIITGTLRVAYWNAETTALPEIYFRLYPNSPAYNGSMTVDRVLVDGVPVTPQLSVEKTVLGLVLASPLLPGKQTVVEMSFQVRVPLDSQSGYGVLNYASDIIVLNNFYPMLAVYDDKGWNIEPIPEQGDSVYSDVSFYQVRLTLPGEMVVATSGSITGQTKNADGTMTWTFVTGPVRDLGVVLSPDFEVAEASVGDIRIRSFYLPKHKAVGKALLTYARNAFLTYGKCFGPYPYVEFDIIETPIRAGGMESPGITMLKDEHYATEGGYIEFVLAHEVAHQWWYGLVGNDQPDEPWVDEALTNYTAIIYYEDVYGAEAADSALRGYLRDPYQRAVGDGLDMPANLPASAYADLVYYRIVYAKAGLFYHELRQRLGDAQYFAILREYLDKHRYGIVSGAQVLEFWRSRAGKDISDLIQKWLLEPAAR